ncbi:MAG: Asp-tRNA(Asn)/Glu-tRNA(Gln) amidotransferase subunit GatB [Candidatus Saganbacteria bacterium]|nr:Asp-tRNA(Asn)/Glu-tRNA(Gln) amidotransferase subunit GatB [Candidatus Saganbacteria bacterium]
MKYEIVIGLETHAQLQTGSKMFCSCPTKFGNAPNTDICPVCTGQPGSLPVINRKAVELAVKTALALNCKVNEESIFARKNYFYPDLPKGYQISQFELPLAEHGFVEIEVRGQTKKIRITRVHLEEDAGKLVHKGSSGIKGADYSLVDLNRTGTPLMEIVSEPDIRDPEEARIFMEELAHILQYLEVCDAKLEEGSIRCDANISLRPQGQAKLGTKTEVKNMNSFKAVQKALEAEARRQETMLDGGAKILQETLLFDESSGQVSPMRSKEQSHDYRYFPDPDLLPLYVSKEMASNIAAQVPELPIDKYKRFIEKYNLSSADAGTLVSSRQMADFFESSVSILQEPKLIANWIIGDISAYLNSKGTGIDGTKLTPALLTEMIALIQKGTIGGKTAKDIIVVMLGTGKSAKAIVESSGATQISDESVLLEIIDKVIAENARSVESFKAGKETAVKFLIGQAMKLSKGRANPTTLEELFKKKLRS